MGQQSMKQQARRTAREATARRRRARAEREQRIEELVVEALTALGERDAAEQRAGRALVDLTGRERLSLTEAVEWCNGQLSVREATRLRQIVRSAGDGADEGGEPLSVTAPTEVGGAGDRTSAG